MTATVNGIGTHYYGKRNSHSRRDMCHSCNQYAELVSYDTTLWFVIFFIPVIPLGRKRITDQCQLCQRHYVSNLEAWKKHRQESIAATVEEFRKSPTVETALDTHATLAGFRQIEDAKKFRSAALELLGEHPNLLLGFASHLDQISSDQDATPYYNRLLELRPDSLEARYGVAVRKADAGELNQALKLLDFLLQPGAGKVHPLGLLEFLADRYQATGRPDEALKLYEHLLREFPETGKNYAFRKKIRKAEAAALKDTSLLPQSKRHWWDLFTPGNQDVSPSTRWAAFICTALVLVAIGCAMRNEYLRTHRTLFVISGFTPPWTVQVDELPPVSPGPMSRVTVSEGSHRIKVNGPQPYEENINMHSGYWQRFWRSPAWVYNVKKSAPLIEATVYYSKTPRQPEFKLAIDNSLKYFEHIDHAFEEPPDSIKVKGAQEVYRTTLQVMPASPVQALAMHANDNRFSDAMDLAESFLSSAPIDETLALFYTSMAEKSHSVPRALKFLKERRDASPFDVECHRAYQLLADTADGYDELLQDYQARSKKQPDDGRLLYLFARLVRDPTEHTELMTKAAAMTPDSHRPSYALAYQHAATGEWEQCLNQLTEAEKRGAPAKSLAGVRHAAMIGCGRANELATDYAAKNPTATRELGDLFLLFDALKMSGRGEEIPKELTAWELLRAKSQQKNNAESITEAKLLAESLKGDATAPDQWFMTRLNAMTVEQQLIWRLALKQPDVIANSTGAMEQITDGWMRLSLGIGLLLQGHKELAQTWLLAANQSFKSSNYSDRFAAQLLEAGEPPTDEQLRTTLLTYAHQGLLLSALALRFPDARARLTPMLEKLDVTRIPPYVLIHQTIESLKSGSPAG